MDPSVKIGDSLVELLGVRIPRHSVDPGRRLLLQLEEGGAETFLGDVMLERRELPSLVLVCSFAHTIQRTWRANFPALRPGRVLLVRVSLGRAPSLHRLRRRVRGLVRRLRRYYEPV